MLTARLGFVEIWEANLRQLKLKFTHPFQNPKFRFFQTDNSHIFSMASISATLHFLLIFSVLSISSPTIFSATVVEDLNNLHPPPDFNTTIANNCKNNPSLRYCNNLTPLSLPEIFKFTVVASHLCNESKNPNCVESFPNINLKNRPKIVPLYLSFDFFWKYCPLTIISIDLANNSLKGDFPYDIFHCSQIQSLDLSHNDLSGDLPIQNFSVLTNLTFLNLSYNHFSESKISNTQFFKRFNSSSFLHSGLIPDHGTFRIKALLAFIGFPIFVILVVVCLCWLCFQRPDFLPGVFGRKQKFTPSILKAATDGFSKRNLVAKGKGVHIYKGLLRDGSEVRVEIYPMDNLSSRKDRQIFIAECRILVQLWHKNLVQVLGWCDNRQLRAIVTEWIDGEDIEMWLSRSAPPWKQRVKALKGIVEGMCYLHEEWPEVGYDLKTSSILLSDDREPLISRFKVKDRTKCSQKVYKLGVLLLEMVTNRRPREEFESGEAGLLEWARMHFPEKVLELIDKRMKKTDLVLDQATQLIQLSLMCADFLGDRQPGLVQISDMITAIYNTAETHNSNCKQVYGDCTTGYKQKQSR